MTKIHFPATERSPLVEFDLEARRFRIEGESYPEDVEVFYGPVVEALRRFVDAGGGGPLEADMHLTYVNSSSIKALAIILAGLDDAAESGASVTVRWRHDADDDTMQEFGEECARRMKHLNFLVQAC